MLLLLGAKDRRVPMSNGQQYLAALRERGVEASSIVFPDDSHPLDKPQTEYEQWLTVLWWLQRHMGPPAASPA